MAVYINTKTLAYPVSESDIRAQFPLTSFGDAFVAPEPFEVVFPVPAPSVNRLQLAVEGAPTKTSLGTWQQTWSVVDRFADVLDASGNVVTTKAAQETAELERAKGELKVAATSQRWTVQTGGLTLPDGTKVLTADADLTRIDQAINNLTRYGIASIDFKSAGGWVTLTLDQLNAIGHAVTTFVQGCFTAERAHHAAIDALADTLDAIDGYSVTANWPSNVLTA